MRARSALLLWESSRVLAVFYELHHFTSTSFGDYTSNKSFISKSRAHLKQIFLFRVQIIVIVSPTNHIRI